MNNQELRINYDELHFVFVYYKLLVYTRFCASKKRKHVIMKIISI